MPHHSIPSIPSVPRPPSVEAARERRRGFRGRRLDELGITTAEYAIGTAAGAGLAGVLYKLVTSGFGDRMLRSLYSHALGMLGIG